MILLEGSEHAVSFADETSLDSRQTSNQKISIQAEVIREKPLDWFLKLLSYFPDIKGELKSQRAVEGYLSLQESDRSYINSTLKFVRIHIVDPRPYLEKMRKAISEILPSRNADLFLENLEASQEEVAQRLLNDFRRGVARQMYFDAPHRRLNHLVEALKNVGGYGLRNPFQVKDKYGDFDDKPFVNRKGRIRLDALSLYLSKSGPVFMDAIDGLHTSPVSPSLLPGQVQIITNLSKVRAFDKGDDKAIKWVDNKRHESIKAVDPYSHLSWLSPLKPLESISSEKSIFIQAADIAAGIAKSIYERLNLIAVARQFEHTTYNGQRISCDEAAAVTSGRQPKIF